MLLWGKSLLRVTASLTIIDTSGFELQSKISADPPILIFICGLGHQNVGSIQSVS